MTYQREKSAEDDGDARQAAVPRGETWIDKLSPYNRARLAALQLEYPEEELTASKFWAVRARRALMSGDIIGVE